MPLSPNRWRTISESEFPWEREALDYLREALPDQEPFRAWSNFEFITDDGRIYEVDLLLLSAKGLFLVEIKSRPGELRADSHTWVWREGVSQIEHDNPLLLANRKAKCLASLRRVLILDEVHAYDAYMQREMERLLEFQAGLGGSAILLSATLPVCIRRRLTDAFTKGLGREVQDASPSMEYPLATVCAGEVRSVQVGGRTGCARTLPVRFLRSFHEALREVEQAAGADKAVLYIRNTVDDVLDAHTALTARGLKPQIFHARLALVDRLAIEKQVVERFGKRSTPAGRKGQVLIATQVVEQSLDLDFDALITDLAPVDLLIQRAGRLWRHDRPERAGHELAVLLRPIRGARTAAVRGAVHQRGQPGPGRSEPAVRGGKRERRGDAGDARRCRGRRNPREARASP